MSKVNAKRCECGAHLDPSMNDKLHIEFEKPVVELESFQPTWECRNCWRILPRKVYGKSEGMTPSQVEAIEHFKTRFLNTHSLGKPEEYEFKTCEIKDAGFGGNVWLSIEVGKIGDEKTAGSIFCRNRVLVMVGRRGGYTFHVYHNGKSYKFHDIMDCVYGEVKERQIRKGD